MTLGALRRLAVSHSLFPPTTLQGAIDRLGFVQADPIRAPARAQDLILRHRVGQYRAGDLERQYARLAVEEDYLYAYGFLSRQVWRLLHPRKSTPLRTLEAKVLEIVRLLGAAHPRELEARLGRRRVVNAWGRYSKATTHALEWLHWRGALRVVRRDNGIRVYEPAMPVDASLSPRERLRALIMVYARIFAPAPEKSLHTALMRHGDLAISKGRSTTKSRRDAVRAELKAAILSGELVAHDVDGVRYVWPAAIEVGEPGEMVRFLAPFDPLVWDRARFEHFWGWQYRFEAYTPLKKRVRGYYAMPLLWRDDVIGWVTAARIDGRVKVDAGFVTKPPRDKAFARELEQETARLNDFLQTPCG